MAENCETVAKACRRCQGELGQYWQGDAANSYANGLAQLIRDNTDLAQEIRRMAAVITQVANEMEEEDRALAAKIAAQTASRAAGALSSSSAGVRATGAAPSVIPAAKTATRTKDNVSTLASSAFDLASRLFGRG